MVPPALQKSHKNYGYNYRYSIDSFGLLSSGIRNPQIGRTLPPIRRIDEATTALAGLKKLQQVIAQFLFANHPLF